MPSSGPAVGMLPLALDECVPVLAQTVTDEPGIQAVAVADHQGAHRHGTAAVPSAASRRAEG